MQLLLTQIQWQLKDPYTFNIDELKPSLDAASTQTLFTTMLVHTAEKTDDSTRLVVAFR